MFVWPLTHPRRNLCGHLLTGSELCPFGHFTYSPERNSVCLATYTRGEISLFGYVITYRRRNTHSAFVWPFSHQCRFGHFLTSVCLATFSSVSGHLHTRVCLATYSPVCLATFSPVSGHLHIRVCLATYSPVCLATYSPVCVWPLTHQRRKGAVLWDVEHTLIHTQRLVEVLSVVY